MFRWFRPLASRLSTSRLLSSELGPQCARCGTLLLLLSVAHPRRGLQVVSALDGDVMRGMPGRATPTSTLHIPATEKLYEHGSDGSHPRILAIRDSYRPRCRHATVPLLKTWQPSCGCSSAHRPRRRPSSSQLVLSWGAV